MKHAALIPLLFCSVMATARSADDVVADFESVPAWPFYETFHTSGDMDGRCRICGRE